MLDHSRRHGVVRTNQAVLPSSDAIGRSPGETHRSFADRRSVPGFAVAVAERPGILRRMARAAKDAVREVRDTGDVPLPHLYRGRDYRKSRNARAA